MELAARKEQDRIGEESSLAYIPMPGMRYPPGGLSSIPREKAVGLVWSGMVLFPKQVIRSGCPCLNCVPMGSEGVVYGEFPNGLLRES